MVHIHLTGKKNRGFPVAPADRCVTCGKTTNGKNKVFLQCNQSTDDGGKICEFCSKALNISPGDDLNCHDWIKTIESCYECCKTTDALYPCHICDERKCISCLFLPSFELFIEFGSTYIICNDCVPSEILTDETGNPYDGQSKFINDHLHKWCHMCQQWHWVAPSSDKFSCTFIPGNEPAIINRIIKIYEDNDKSSSITEIKNSTNIKAIASQASREYEQKFHQTF